MEGAPSEQICLPIPWQRPGQSAGRSKPAKPAENKPESGVPGWLAKSPWQRVTTGRDRLAVDWRPEPLRPEVKLFFRERNLLVALTRKTETTMQPLEMALEAALLVIQNGGSTVAAERSLRNILTGFRQEGVVSIWRLDFIGAWSTANGPSSMVVRPVGPIGVNLARASEVAALRSARRKGTGGASRPRLRAHADQEPPCSLQSRCDDRRRSVRRRSLLTAPRW